MLGVVVRPSWCLVHVVSIRARVLEKVNLNCGTLGAVLWGVGKGSGTLFHPIVPLFPALYSETCPGPPCTAVAGRLPGKTAFGK